MYIIFIHFFADGHLGCVHVLDIVNSAAVNFGVRFLKFQYLFLFSTKYFFFYY